MIRFHPALRATAVAGAVLLAVAGCTPSAPEPTATGTAPATSTPAATPTSSATSTPSSTPTTSGAAPTAPPALTDLVLDVDGLHTPDGAGSLIQGEPVPADAGGAAVAIVDPDFCEQVWAENGVEPIGSPARWLANYPRDPASEALGGAPFWPLVDGESGPLLSLVIGSPSITTDEGVGIGSPRSAVEAAYGRTAIETRSDSPDYVDAYTLVGDRSSVTFEVLKSTDLVVLAHVDALTEEPLVLYASDGGPYSCGLV